jgi:phosphoglycolate phosphatase
MISGILFDKDGTLFDFQVSWSGWARAFLGELAEGDDREAARLGALIGYDWETSGFHPDSHLISGTDEDTVTALLPEIPGATPASLRSRISLAAANAPMAEAVPLVPFLAALKERGLRIGVATNDSEYSARAHLEQAGILEQFDFVAGADSGFGPKPGPGMCLAFAEAMGLPPAEVLMVGDSLHDLHAGAAAGMRTLGVLTGLAEAHVLAPHADVVLPDIGALLDRLDSANRLDASGRDDKATQTESDSVAI